LRSRFLAAAEAHPGLVMGLRPAPRPDRL